MKKFIKKNNRRLNRRRNGCFINAVHSIGSIVSK